MRDIQADIDNASKRTPPKGFLDKLDDVQQIDAAQSSGEFVDIVTAEHIVSGTNTTGETALTSSALIELANIANN